MTSSIYNYLDYRLFLKDAIAELGKQNSRFTFRAFAREAGYSSPNLLQMVMAGKRKLNHGSVVGTAQALELGKAETDFFANLVGFNEAKSQEKRDLYYQRLSRSHTFSRNRILDRAQYDFASRWYGPVVRELLIHPDYSGDPAWIAGRTEPAISVDQVNKTIELLLELGLVSRDGESGKWKQTDTSISTPPEARSLAIRKYHKEMIRMADRALEKIPAEERDIRGLTIGVSAAAFEGIKTRLTAFWQELLQYAADQSSPETVYQLNMQFFPLVKMDAGRHLSATRKKE